MGEKAPASSPCASCKLLRRRCAKDCVFAPYFPPEDPQKFASVHKVFGASNVSKMLQELPVQQRGDAVSSMVYEASARLRDPVYGCVGTISYLQQQVVQLQMQLAMAQAEILCMHMQRDSSDLPNNSKNYNSNYSVINRDHQKQLMAQAIATGQTDGNTARIIAKSSHPQPSDCSTTSAYSMEDHDDQSANGNKLDVGHLVDTKDSLWT